METTAKGSVCQSVRTASGVPETGFSDILRIARTAPSPGEQVQHAAAPFLRRIAAQKQSETQRRMATYLAGPGPHAAWRLRMCGREFRFGPNKVDGSFRLSGVFFCGQWKLCLICAERRSWQTLKRLRLLLNETDRTGGERVFSFVTLTVKADRDLSHAFSRVDSALKRASQRRRFARCPGRPISIFAQPEWAIQFIETDRNAMTGLWHVHVHCIWCTAQPVNEKALKHEWAAVSNGYQIHVRPIQGAGIVLSREGRERQLNIAAKYSTKPSRLRPEDRLALHLATKGRRLIRVWGNLPPLAKELAVEVETEGIAPDGTASTESLATVAVATFKSSKGSFEIHAFSSPAIEETSVTPSIDDVGTPLRRNVTPSVKGGLRDQLRKRLESLRQVG